MEERKGVKTVDMINNVGYSEKKGVYIEYYKDGVYQGITYEQIRKVWPWVYFDDEDTDDEDFDWDRNCAEGSRFHVWQDYIAFIILVGSAQGGALFVWDTNSMEFIHYSDASYCCDFTTDFSTMFILCEVTNFVTPYHLQVYRIPFGVKDSSDKGKRMYCEVPQPYKNEKDMFNLRIKIKNNKSLFIIAEDGEHLYSSNIDEIEKQKPNENFLDLYKEWENQLDPGKRVMLGMIT